ncbi:TonB-dependent receptor domain-containing protein [Thioalkalivibrio sp. ALMg13-2]|uniref:TonB-dependent receptor domain-containing protein n=1 Tax=Thioalkalivibrio sp. ALMg13-2 TaxID=1158167 RepID=UPI0003673133|nr:TonB-dependent receptor [Thioalkalivibrio sp. ALMg13-2]
MKRTALSSAILLAMTPALAHAQDAPETEAQTLDTVQVTATRVAQTVDETLASVTIIDREEIERLQPKQFTDLLEGRAGMETSQNSAFGKTTSVYTRGTNSDHTLLLVDGVRMGSATTGGASWQFLPLEEIERVEIVRGPRTSVYGSDAIGGGVQGFTREGRKGPPKVNAFVGGGSFNTWEAGVGVAGGTDSTSYSFSISHFDTDGINVQDDFGDDDPNGYDNTSLSTKVSHRLENGIEVFGSILYSEGESEFDSTEGRDYTDYVHAAVRGGVRLAITDRWETEVSLTHSRDENDRYNDGSFASRYNTTRDSIDWLNEIALTDRLFLTAGLDAREDRIEVDDPGFFGTEKYEENSRYNVGSYALLQAELGDHLLEGSLRHDDDELFGDKTTGQIAWGLQATDALRLRASYGTAFKAPTFNELYHPDIGWYRGNPDLVPEESETFEIGARYSAGGAYLDVSVFETRVDDLIQSQCVANCDAEQFFMMVNEPANINEARIRGLEIEGGHDFGLWTSRASLTLVDAKDRETGNELQRRSPVTARFDLDRQFQDFLLGGSVIGKSRSYNDAGNEHRLSGYGLMNLRAGYQIDPEWRIEASVDNVFDKDYETVGGYNQPGRAAFVKLRYQQR